MKTLYRIVIFALSLIAVSCAQTPRVLDSLKEGYAECFTIVKNDDGGDVIIVKSPYDGSCDSMIVKSPMNSIVCMSSTYVAGLCAIGASSAVTAVSGIGYISDSTIRANAERILDVGYEPSIDLEGIVNLHPDLVLAYSTSAVKPAYVGKLESLGVKVLMLYDYLEEHPLARAEYLRLYGCLTGRMEKADSLFEAIATRYEDLSSTVEGLEKVPVLMNVPYADVWYVPGKDNYMSRLVSDAGAIILGSQDGTESSTISMEKAFELSTQAKVWLNPGWNLTRKEISYIHPIIANFPLLQNGRIYNNIKRTTPEGGNDFWESGSVRPDLVLADLVKIMHPELETPDDSLEYYIEVE